MIVTLPRVSLCLCTFLELVNNYDTSWCVLIIVKLPGPLFACDTFWGRYDYDTSLGFFIIIVENLRFAYHSEI